jgi:cell division protein FtsW (lipid II flippase)
MLTAGALLFGYLAVTLAPAVRTHSWNVTYNFIPWLGYVVWLVVYGVLHDRTRKYLPERDPYLLPVVAFLTGIGILAIWRISPAFGLRQTIWLAVCGAVGFFLLSIPRFPALLRKYKYVWLVIAFLITALTFIIGVFPSGNGPRLWLDFFGIYFQPSEPLKLLLITYLAAYMSEKSPVTSGYAAFIMPTAVMTGIALMLLIAQKDLGTTLILIGIYAVMLYLSTGRKRSILISMAVVALAGVIGYFTFDVVRLRITAWLNPWTDPTGRSYQIVQSLIAIASGGLTGAGPGLGSPSLVPIAHSDFIFTSITEEGGLFIACVLLLILGLLATRGLRAAIDAHTRYERYLAAGITVFLIGQALLIIGGNIRLLPLTGVTLPFVSYGGSSLTVSMIALFILITISHHPDEEPAPLADSSPYHYLLGGIFVLLMASALITGWWTVVRRDNLVSRSDNPRRTISDRYVLRGAILDRNGKPIIHSEGTSGSLKRITDYSPLAPVIGYTDSVYGQSSLESSYDSYLRGISGYPFTTVLWNELLTNQPPAGLDIRTTIDLGLQESVDSALGGMNGAAVVVNAGTGDILSMASHPGFDPSLLNEQWYQLVSSADKPLLNRAAAGLYPPGRAVAPFLLAATQSTSFTPETYDSYIHTMQDTSCALTLPSNYTVPDMVRSGCATISTYLGELLGTKTIYNLYQSAGFFTAPSLPILTADVTQPGSLADLSAASVGQGELQVSPLQMALASAAISNSGERPQAKLVTAVKSSDDGWQVVTTPVSSIRVISAASAQAVADQLTLTGMQAWGSVGTSQSGENSTVTWFIGGSLSQWTGTPFSVAVLIEEDNPKAAYAAGVEIIKAIENIK